MNWFLFQRVIPRTCVWMVVVALSGAVALTQNTTEGPTVLHSTTRLVLVDVHVSTPDGAPVQGLSKDSFEVKEDGVRQSIKGFDEHSPKIDQSSLPPLDFQLPARTFINLEPTSSTGPLCVIFFDQLNTPIDSQMWAHGEILRFLRNKDAGTQVAIFVLGNRLTMLQGFTTDTGRLVAAMNTPAGKPKLTAWGGDSDLSLDANGDPSYLSNDPAVTTKRFQAAQRTLDAFIDIGQFLAAAPGRKNLLWFSQSFQALQLPTMSDKDVAETAQQQSDGTISGKQQMTSRTDSTGINLDLGRMSDNSVDFNILADRVRKVSTELAVTQTAVYPIDAHGLAADPGFSAGGSPTTITSQKQGSIPGLPGQNGEAPAFIGNSNYWNQSLDATQATMRQIAEATGGEAFINTNNLARAAARAVNEGSYFYTLSYSPANAKFDGSLRGIHVSLKKRDSGVNYRLTYRTAYYADDPNVVAPVSVKKDVLEAALPHILLARIWQALLVEQLGMHAHHQHLFIIRTIEDPDAAALGQVLHVAPHEVVIELFARGLLETHDLAALRIHPGHDELDGAVLAGRIHGLQHDQHSPLVLGVELVLHLGEVTPALLQHGNAVFLVAHTSRAAGGKFS